MSGRRVPEFAPKYQLILSGYAQVQNIHIQNEYMTVIDNDNTVTVIKSDFTFPDRDVAEESKAAERQVSASLKKDDGPMNERDVPRLSVNKSVT